MLNFLRLAILFAGLILLPVEAFGQGEVQITHAKVLAGNVTPGDPAGYPAILSAPGSYILAGNLAPGPNLNGIVAAAPDITIDLNGFRISGGPAGGTNNARIGIWGQTDRLRVRNGTIGGFELAGISHANHAHLVVENMTIVNNYYGIFTTGSFARIQNNTVAVNSYRGITCGPSCHIEGNVVSGNGDQGINIPSGSVLGNTISSNGSFGVISNSPSPGFGFGNNTVVSNNGGSDQLDGSRSQLFPNYCAPTSC
jgi:hypothetical protein